MRKLHTGDEAVIYLGLDRTGLKQPREALRWLCRSGRLKFTKVGRRVMFDERWLDELIDLNSKFRERSSDRCQMRHRPTRK